MKSLTDAVMQEASHFSGRTISIVEQRQLDDVRSLIPKWAYIAFMGTRFCKSRFVLEERADRHQGVGDFAEVLSPDELRREIVDTEYGRALTRSGLVPLFAILIVRGGRQVYLPERLCVRMRGGGELLSVDRAVGMDGIVKPAYAVEAKKGLLQLLASPVAEFGEGPTTPRP